MIPKKSAWHHNFLTIGWDARQGKQQSFEILRGRISIDFHVIQFLGVPFNVY